jgi:hypothetical protein
MRVKVVPPAAADAAADGLAEASADDGGAVAVGSADAWSDGGALATGA